MGIHHKIKIICGVWLLSFILYGSHLFGQQLTIIKKNKTYWRQVQEDSALRMIELKSLVPSLVYDLRYATTNNFMHRQLYQTGKNTYLRLEVARALQKVETELNTKGYGLKIFDAYRPYSITRKMWDLVHDERYVADPSKGSGHNRGIAVDLTIIYLDSKQEISMGTGFDNFTDTAHQSFIHLPDSVLKNRRLLKETMERNGFRNLETEWWHYSWPNNHNYDVLDVDFKDLEGKKKKTW
jgi:D-alanyl-D-alanine dipeptidase